MTPSEYKKYKEIPAKSKTNLRDNMTDLELIFTMLGEKVTTEISSKEKPKGIMANKKVAKRGGGVAGNARKQTEKELGESVISKQKPKLNDDAALNSRTEKRDTPKAKFISHEKGW